MLRDVVGASVKMPDAVPPPERLSVPTCTSTVPVLLSATPIDAVPTGPVFCRVPALLNAARPAKKLPSDDESGRTNRLPGWLFQIELLVKSKPLPATTVAVPKLSTARVSSIEKKPPLRIELPLRTVWPEPDMFPLDQVHVPSMVSVPEPVTVPLV